MFVDDIADCYAHFDQYEYTQIDDPEEIYRLSSDFLLQAHSISRCPPARFQDNLDIYEEYERFAEGETPTPEHLKYDLIDTLLFLSGRLNQIALSGQCLIIAGI